jgi:hypothetical protein
MISWLFETVKMELGLVIVGPAPSLLPKIPIPGVELGFCVYTEEIKLFSHRYLGGRE